MTSTSTLAELSDIYLTGFNFNKAYVMQIVASAQQLQNHGLEDVLQAPSAAPARTYCTHNTMLETEYKCQTRAVTKG